MKAPTLETARLILRGAEPCDIDFAAAMWGSEEVTRYIGGKPRSRQDAWFALLRGVGLWEMKGFGYWVVTDKATGEFLGEAGFADFERGLPKELIYGPEAGWAFGPQTWGKGVATEAVSAMHAWLDENVSASSCCVIEPSNLASCKVAGKIGYRHTGQTLLAGTPVNTYRRGT
ncbi:putative acetyltransferase [Hyphomonas neptunium ATCC 15444]|uniref:Putative acetyltransferase n=2 Tax=Hyphomonas TaxID=85 RepID=Q0C634_HYPNA|nr:MULTISPECIES: GNAT family N-acetyltransferase [Hyphomonas]ABI76919.1 putative acetyltransferase [Hyphomonas neptunium ATCC 15444]KCZ94888.1 putative acetyltransferase [Hyphomonas hirschiana VP5]